MIASSTKTSVLIVGAGPVGLALAIELGMRSIPCVVVERNDRVGYAPRAKTTNVRTREHMRRWGIAEHLRAASPLGPYYPSNVLFVTRLAGHLLARIENAMYCAPGKNPLYSEHAQWIPQYSVEEVMRRHAASLPSVSIRFSSELVRFEQGQGAVSAEVRSLADKTSYRIVCTYLVGADGARSDVRTAIGATMSGSYGLSRNHNIVFRSPGLANLHRHGPAIMYWQVNRDFPSLLGPMDSDDRWFFMPTQLQEDVKIASADVPALLHRSTGLEFPVEVMSSDEWVASRLIADKYRDRNVFLVGDACHLHPPFGGYGMNMGIADGVDLGWKLAAIVQGWGGTKLLDSYEQERRQVHEWVMNEAVANHALLGKQLWEDGIEDDSEKGEQKRAEIGARIHAAKLREFNTLGVVLGYRYEASPIVVSDGTPEPSSDYLNYIPSARPGSRAPHAWMHDGTSLYDHFGPAITLLAGRDAEESAIDRAVRACAAARVPMRVVRMRDRFFDDLYRARYILVRPDQHVAWRGDSMPEHVGSVISKICGW